MVYENKPVVLPWLKYKGWSTAQVAMYDYSYLYYLMGEAPTGQKPPSWLPRQQLARVRSSIETLRERLEKFESPRKCVIETDGIPCGKTAKYMLVNVLPAQIEASTEWVACDTSSPSSKLEHVNRIRQGREDPTNFDAYRLSFRSIIDIYTNLLKQRRYPRPCAEELREVQEVLVWAIGLEPEKLFLPKLPVLNNIAAKERNISIDELLSMPKGELRAAQLSVLYGTENQRAQQELENQIARLFHPTLF